MSTITRWGSFFLGLCSDVVAESISPEPPSNIVTSWGDGRPAGAPGQAQRSNVPAQPRRYRPFLPFM